MKKRRSEINKWLKGNHNLTLKTLAKLEAELGEPIIITSSQKNLAFNCTDLITDKKLPLPLMYQVNCVVLLIAKSNL